MLFFILLIGESMYFKKLNYPLGVKRQDYLYTQAHKLSFDLKMQSWQMLFCGEK